MFKLDNYCNKYPKKSNYISNPLIYTPNLMLDNQLSMNEDFKKNTNYIAHKSADVIFDLLQSVNNTAKLNTANLRARGNHYFLDRLCWTSHRFAPIKRTLSSVPLCLCWHKHLKRLFWRVWLKSVFLHFWPQAAGYSSSCLNCRR